MLILLPLRVTPTAPASDRPAKSPADGGPTRHAAAPARELHSPLRPLRELALLRAPGPRAGRAPAPFRVRPLRPEACRVEHVGAEQFNAGAVIPDSPLSPLSDAAGTGTAASPRSWNRSMTARSVQQAHRCLQSCKTRFPPSRDDFRRRRTLLLCVALCSDDRDLGTVHLDIDPLDASFWRMCHATYVLGKRRSRAGPARRRRRHRAGRLTAAAKPDTF